MMTFISFQVRKLEKGEFFLTLCRCSLDVSKKIL